MKNFDYLIVVRKIYLPILHLWRLTPYYWPLRNKYEYLKLWFDYIIFRLGLKLKDYYTYLTIIVNFFRTKFVILAAIIIISFIILSADSILKGNFNQEYKLLYQNLQNPKSDYSSFYATIAGSTITLLALFIGAIGVGASNAYSEISSSLKNLILNDKVSKVFLWLLIFLFGLTLTFFIMSYTDLKPGILPNIIITVLLILSVTLAAEVAMREYIFFDPQRILVELDEKLIKWLSFIIQNNLIRTNVSFQNQLRQKCEKLIKIYDDLKLVCLMNYKNSNTAPSIMAQRLILFYSKYCILKQSIPTNNKWFATVTTHPSWFTADSTKIMISKVQLGYHLTPVETINLNWLEERFLQNIVLLLAEDIKNNQLENLTLPLLEIGSAMKKLGKLLLTDEGFLLIGALRSQYLELLPQINDVNIQEPVEQIFIASSEIISKAPTDFTAGFNIFLRDFDFKHIGTIIEGKIKQKKKFQNYFLIRTVEDLITEFRNKLDFEIHIEGKQITPINYIFRRCAAYYTKNILDTVLILIKFFETENLDFIEKIINKNQPQCAAQAIHEGLQFYELINFSISDAARVITNLKNNYNLNDSKDLIFDISNANERIKAVKSKLLQQCATVTLSLVSIKRNINNYPDYLGKGYYLLADSCFQLFASNVYTDKDSNDELFFLFKEFIALVFCLQTFLENHLSENEVNFVPNIRFQQMLDLLELSGYGLIYSTIKEDKPLAKIITTTWDVLLNSLPNAVSVIKSLLLLTELFELDLAPQASKQMLRDWVLLTENELRSRGLINDFTGALYVESENKPPIAPMIEILLDNRFDLKCASRIFAAEYLLARPEASDNEIKELNLPYINDIRTQLRGEDEPVS